MLGGHLDSWHAATGATDNAIGSATMLEAIRILQAIGVKPRRTIRLALWSGEEQGLRGSVAYVAQHFGTFEAPKPEYEHFAGYFNIDSGTGKARGMTVFGPPAAADVLRPLLVPFAGNGVMGASVDAQPQSAAARITPRSTRSGCRASASARIRIEYGTHTWHTNLDTYERVIESDAQQSAMAIATAVYHLAMRDEKLPRFTKDAMPPKPGEPAPGDRQADGAATVAAPAGATTLVSMGPGPIGTDFVPSLPCQASRHSRVSMMAFGGDVGRAASCRSRPSPAAARCRGSAARGRRPPGRTTTGPRCRAGRCRRRWRRAPAP